MKSLITLVFVILISMLSATPSFANGATVSQTGGEYDHQLKVYQELYELPKFGDHYPVIGSWVVHGHSCGIGIREDGLITSNTARFTPHLIK